MFVFRNHFFCHLPTIRGANCIRVKRTAPDLSRSMAGPLSEASLHALVNKADAALHNKQRWARAADLYKRAAQQASALYPHNSLVTAELQENEAHAIQGQSDQPGLSFGERRALHEQAWALVRQQHMTRSLTSLTPGGVDAAQRAGVLAFATSNASCYGVSVAMHLARLCLYRMHSTIFDIPLPLLAAPERGLVEQFVLQALDYLALTRAVTHPIVGESELVHAVRQLLASPEMKPSFRRRWKHGGRALTWWRACACVAR